MLQTPDYMAVAWRHGNLSVQRSGGMLGPLTFILEDGRQVSPLYLPPWAAGKPSPRLPEVLKHFRGEWPCVPFGAYRPREGFPPEWAAIIGNYEDRPYLHGFSSNADWRCTLATPDLVELTCRYPDDDDIEQLVRRIAPVRDRAAVDIELTVTARRRTRQPVGLHFTLAAPRTEALLRPGAFRDAWTYPGPPFEQLQALAPNCRFTDLQRTPASAGGFIDASRFPLPVPCEDLIQLNGVDGHFSIDLPGDDCRVSIDWNPAHFPSVLLWLSSRGLLKPPWNGQHVALGVEPVCSPFGLGLRAARGPNPLANSGIPTAVEFDPSRPFCTTYRISATALGEGPHV